MSISMKKQAFRIGTAFVFAVATVTSFIAFNGQDASAASANIKLINRCPSSVGVTVSWGTGSFRTTVSKYSSKTKGIALFKTNYVRSDMYRNNGSFYTPYSGTYNWVICG